MSRNRERKELEEKWAILHEGGLNIRWPLAEVIKIKDRAHIDAILKYRRERNFLKIGSMLMVFSFSFTGAYGTFRLFNGAFGGIHGPLFASFFMMFGMVYGLTTLLEESERFMDLEFLNKLGIKRKGGR